MNSGPKQSICHRYRIKYGGWLRAWCSNTSNFYSTQRKCGIEFWRTRQSVERNFQVIISPSIWRIFCKVLLGILGGWNFKKTSKMAGKDGVNLSYPPFHFRPFLMLKTVYETELLLLMLLDTISTIFWVRNWTFSPPVYKILAVLAYFVNSTRLFFSAICNHLFRKISWK